MLKKLLLLTLLGTAFAAQAEAAAPSTYRDIARLRAMNQRAQGIRPAADGKSYTTLRGNAIGRSRRAAVRMEERQRKPRYRRLSVFTRRKTAAALDRLRTDLPALLYHRLLPERRRRPAPHSDRSVRHARRFVLARRTDDRLLERQQPLPLRHRRGFRASDHDRRCMEPDYQRYDRLGI